jgi:hypothetical protein
MSHHCDIIKMQLRQQSQQHGPDRRYRDIHWLPNFTGFLLRRADHAPRIIQLPLPT